MAKRLIGIDEAGRGPIAGPVAVGAFIFLTGNHLTMFRGVKECKQLSEEKREYWYKKILDAKASGKINYYVSLESEKVIDGKGITYAIRKGLKKALDKIEADPKNSLVLLDGGLKAPKSFKNQKTIIKGDEKKKVIALASICAKVTRDRYMREMARHYPGYGFDIHKGYGTREHYEALKKLGESEIHRKSFLRKFTEASLVLPMQR